MIYDSLDKIPLKIYLEILKSENLTLLTDDNDKLGELTEIWTKLKADFKLLDPNNSFDKTLKNMIKVELFSSKYTFLEYAIRCITFERDEELENCIRELNYKLQEKTFKADLKRVDNHRKALLIKIEQYSSKLPKSDGKRPSNIDEVILGYCSAMNIGYDTNKITVTQFYSLKNLFDKKLKAAKEEAARQKSKQRKKR